MTINKKTAPQNATGATRNEQADLAQFKGKAAVGVVRDVINHKVEQIIRAVYLGLSEQNVYCSKGTALENFKADDWVVIGRADHRGYRFSPDTNTRLIMLGLNPSSVLASLTRMRFHGTPVVAVQGELLIAMHGAIAQNARDQLFNTEKLLTLYRTLGKPKLFS